MPMASSWPRRQPIKPWPDPSATLPASCSANHLPCTIVQAKTVASGGTIMKNRAHFRALALGFAGAVLLTATANAAEVRVMISGGLTAAFNALVPVFEKQTGNKVLVAYGPS